MRVKEYTLKDLITIKNGKDYRNIESGNIPVYGTGGVMTYINDYLYDGESILLPRKGSLDNIGYVNDKFWTVDTMYWSIVNKELAYPKYLYCYLKLLDLSCRDSGSTLPSMTFDSYYTLKINLPNIEIQKKIGDFIFGIVNKIEKNNKIILELEAMAKTIYDYWFLQYEFPNEEGKPYKSSSGKMVYNEELKKEIPEGWNVKSIKDCIEHINTGLNPRDNFVLGNGNIKYITVKNLTKEGIINYDGCDVIDEKAKEIVHNRSEVDVGDILFASIAPLGRCFMVQEYPSEWDINESVFCIRPNHNVISTEYLYLYFTSESFIKQAENSSTGSIFSGIRINTLESIKLLVPNKNVKELFSHSIKNIFLKKYKIAKENEELTKLRDELLPLLMNGQVGFKE